MKITVRAKQAGRKHALIENKIIENFADVFEFENREELQEMAVRV